MAKLANDDLRAIQGFIEVTLDERLAEKLDEKGKFENLEPKSIGHALKTKVKTVPRECEKFLGKNSPICYTIKSSHLTMEEP